jgi:hypothetical protein
MMDEIKVLETIKHRLSKVVFTLDASWNAFNTVDLIEHFHFLRSLVGGREKLLSGTCTLLTQAG